MPAEDPTSFWAAPLPPGSCAAMAAKYDALRALECMSPGPGRRAALRRAAAAWPGSLRESQLVGPEICAARRRAAASGAQAPSRSRAWWCRVTPALPLWSALHPLLGDLLAWRRSQLRRESAPLALIDFVSRGECRLRWDPAAIPSLAGPRVQARLAYRWLAAQSGLPVAVLYRTLFVRGGRWERREGDLRGSTRALLPLEIAGFFPLLSGPP